MHLSVIGLVSVGSLCPIDHKLLLQHIGDDQDDQDYQDYPDDQDDGDDKDPWPPVHERCLLIGTIWVNPWSFTLIIWSN